MKDDTRPPLPRSLRLACIPALVLGATCLILCGIFLELIPCASLDIALNRSGCLGRMRGTGTSVSGVAISPDGQLVAARLYDQTRVWRLSDGELFRSLGDGISSTAWCLEFSPDAQLLASGCSASWPDTYQIRVWDVEAGSLYSLLPQANPTSIAFSPDSRTLASASYDQVLLWDIDSASLLLRFGPSPQGAYLVAFSPDGSQIATASLAGSQSVLRIWRSSDAHLLRTKPLEEELKSMIFATDSQALLIATTSGNLFWWNLPQDSLSPAVSLPIRESIRQASFSTDGQIFATGREYFVDLWATKSGHLIRSFHVGSGRTAGIAVSSATALVAAGAGYDVEIWRFH